MTNNIKLSTTRKFGEIIRLYLRFIGQDEEWLASDVGFDDARCRKHIDPLRQTQHSCSRLGWHGRRVFPITNIKSTVIFSNKYKSDFINGNW